MTILRDKEVRFDEYCPKCKFKDLPEAEDPCDLCLENPSNEWSHKPVYFEEAEGLDSVGKTSNPHAQSKKKGSQTQR